MPSSSEDVLLFLRARRDLRRPIVLETARRLRDSVAGGRSFSCLLTDDRELQRLNRQFFKKDYATDVIAFPEPGPDDFLGELAISVERASEQAKRFGHSVEQEVGILMLHGLLHLLGMDHEKDRGRMARTETRWRKKLGLPAGLVERVRS
jgi:probable rRNA maturation factor